MTAGQIEINQVPYVDYICGWNQHVMKILGIWPEERRINKISSYVVLISISVMALFITIPQTINLFIIWGDFDLVVENLSVGNLKVWISIIKTIAFWSNGKTLKKLLLCMEEHRREAKNREEVKVMMKSAKLCRTLSTGSIIFTIVYISATVIARIWMNHYTSRALIVTIYSPYDHLTTPNYELTMVGQTAAGWYGIATYVMVDLFLATLVFHACAQFANLKSRVHSLHSKGRYESHAELADIIKKHNALFIFVETIENLFNYMLLMQVLGCTILLCIQSFQAMANMSGQSFEIILPQLIFFGFYISYVLLQLYLYCYTGEKLHSESISMIEAAYKCNWYDLSPSEARSVMLIMVRASKPLCLTAGKFYSLNHELFKNILKTSMSYLSVLYAMKTNRGE